ncbi:Sulfate/bicarbonate/oxalate exchanger SAT-1 and related transporters (SLC26 family) [Handroanthus impetiginosus]|uniref:Sulfate/bicarbonate/oxalate exchanger SAT-1 and related transporters (SLC26 family) n=1 Tax=Handroanthus impetiginosus TaxID=429701 RepID=A0A2G9HJR5_9LAMI|nr:Sulfate/bicarbonate/oxalate exchanger SAT-1 and related transporters (SLC26 family) [Handroanthus impetiginosus]
MGNGDNEIQQRIQVQIPPRKPFSHSLKSSLKETFFPDDPFKQLKNQPVSRKFILCLQYFVPILEWAPRYNFEFFKADFIAGITIASLAVPQGISYAGLASLPPVIGLYSSFVPPLIYAMLGSSRDLAVGTVAVPSLLISSMLGKEVNPHQNTKLYMQLVFTATFFAGVFQAALGLLRLGFIVDFLSHATIVGFMGGAATVVCLQQLKGILGLVQFTHGADLVSVMKSVFTQIHMWRWESGVLGCCFLFFLFITRYFSRKKPVFFWINALAPLTSVILGSLLVYFTQAEKHGVEIIGHLKKGLNPPSVSELETAFGSPHLLTAIKTGVITGVIALAVMMATAVMITLLFLTPLFHYTPLVVLSTIIMAAMISVIDYEAAIHLWSVDKFDFIVCISAYIGVVFGSVEMGLIIAVAISLLRILLFVARPRTTAMGNIRNTRSYRSIEQYPDANFVPGILILHVNAPVYFANASYLRERILRWIDDEEDKLKHSAKNDLQYVILDMSAVGNIDTSGISMLEELKKNIDRRCIKLALANPGGEVMKKLDKSKFIDTIGHEWIFLTVGEAVNGCNIILQACKAKAKAVETEAADNKV